MSWRVLLCDLDGNVIEDVTPNVVTIEMSTDLDLDTYNTLLRSYYSHCPGCGEQWMPDGTPHACAQPPFEF